MEGLFWLLLPVAAYSGWYAATRCSRQDSINTFNKSNLNVAAKNYSEAIANLITDHPDKAVDIVIDKVEVSPDTVEVYMALGNLFRRNGEVGRAIRLHQNLTEKHSLSPQQRESVLYELGQDYLSAGLLDRAERIFKDLTTSVHFKKLSTQALVEVYQQEKDWDSAILYSEKYEKLTKSTQKHLISQFYCEMAEKKINERQFNEARDILRKALNIDKSCVRANLLMGDYEFKEKEYNAALAHYKSILDYDTDFLPEIMDNMVYCFQYSEITKTTTPILPSVTEEKVVNNAVVSMQDHRMVSNRALKFIEQELDKNASAKLLDQYLYLTLDEPEVSNRRILSRVKNSINMISNNASYYRCKKCGLTAHSLHWQCPSCHSWSNIKPI